MYESTELTRGPWDPLAQHAGPSCALIGERIAGVGGSERADWVIGRITYEILSPIPIAPLRVDTEVVRPGRSVELIEATLSRAEPGPGDQEGPIVRARAWRIRSAHVDIPEELDSRHAGSPARQAGRPTGGVGMPVGPEQLQGEEAFFPGAGDVGYHTGIEYRFARGAFNSPGAATAWMRMLRPLVAGEQPSPLTRVLIVADSGNGVSSALDFETHVFINVDLTVNLHRLPEGEWVCLDSITVPSALGVGLADTALFDAAGPIGHATQTLLVAGRG